jgi:D-amino-acid oxidase
VKAGISFTTVSVNPQLYLPYLQSALISLGATFVRRHLSHVREAFALTSPVVPSAVINATGLLASRLGGVEDKAVFPSRGQTILVRNEYPKQIAHVAWDKNKEEMTYIIPRGSGGGTILGGCRQPNNWYITHQRFLMRSRNSEVDPNLALRIASRCVVLAPDLVDGKGIEGLDIVRHNVGFRPSREGGARLEADFLDIGLVVHNYGAQLSSFV